MAAGSRWWLAVELSLKVWEQILKMTATTLEEEINVFHGNLKSSMP